MKMYMDSHCMEDATAAFRETARAQGIVWADGAMVPTATRPVPFPPRADAEALAPLFGALVARACVDADWLEDTLRAAAAADPHVRFLLRTRRPQRRHLAFLRSDYMMAHGSSSHVCQVELNTMACAFAALSTRVGALHGVPNGALEGLCDALAAVHGEEEARATEDTVVVMVVREEEANVRDQQLVVDALARRGVPCVRRTLRALRGASTRGDGGALVLEDGRRVSVVYFRACYDAWEHAEEWQRAVRAAIERSDAVKCPSMDVELVGTKKVQQALAAPGGAERFLPPDAAARVRRHFAGLWAAEALPDAVRAAVHADPSAFVLKPQREGGGHNLHGAAILEALARREDAAQYVLMERIRPPAEAARVTVVDEDGARALACPVAELGVFSVLVATGAGAVARNEGVGWLLRVKEAREPEGGVACGASALASPCAL